MDNLNRKLRHLLRTTALAGLVGLVGGGALAGVPLVLEDGFDYTDTELNTTQLGLAYQDGALTLRLGADAGGALPAVAVGDYPRFEEGEQPAGTYLADELPGVELDVRAGVLYSARFEHVAGSLAEVIDAYVSELTSLGFAATHEASHGNVEVYRFANGEGALRAVFTPTGVGGRAYIASL